nr:hypothetical protein [Candidatus Akkermansia timonensis]
MKSWRPEKVNPACVPIISRAASSTMEASPRYRVARQAVVRLSPLPYRPIITKVGISASSWKAKKEIMLLDRKAPVAPAEISRAELYQEASPPLGGLVPSTVAKVTRMVSSSITLAMAGARVN